MCHQALACPKHNGEVRMGDTTTSLPRPGVGVASATLRETAPQHV